MYMGNKNGRYIHNNEIENASSYLNLEKIPLSLIFLHVLSTIFTTR